MSTNRWHPAHAGLCIIFICLILFTAGCGTATPTQVEAQETQQTVSPPITNRTDTPVPPTETLTTEPSPTDTVDPATPADLASPERWLPYDKDDPNQVLGDARLVPGYEPLRIALKELNPDLAADLLNNGLKINTARSVRLEEETVLTGLVTSLEKLAFVEIEPRLLCLFARPCDIPEAFQEDKELFIKGYTGMALLRMAATSPGQEGFPGAGLYGYRYQLDFRELRPDQEKACFTAIQMNFGPVAPVDYNGDGQQEFGFIQTSASLGPRPAAVEKKGQLLTISFEKPICPGGESAVFGMASVFPPTGSEVIVVDEIGNRHPGNIALPDTAQGKQVVETVTIAPVVSAEESIIFDEARIRDTLAGPGLYLGMLLLESNAEESPLPAGAYLERAFMNDGEGTVIFIDARSGEEVYKVPVWSSQAIQPAVVVPTAAIFLGSKYCYTCIIWCFCRECSPWNSRAESYEACLARFNR